MQQGSDFSSSYYTHHYPVTHPNPNPNPNLNEFMAPNPIQPTYTSASAPPYSNYPSADFPAYSSPSPYPSYTQNPDPLPNLPPSAPSYAQPQSQSQPPPPPPQFPPFQPYNPSPFPPESSPAAPYPHLQQPSALNYYPYDPQQPPAANYAPPPNPNPNPNPNPGPGSNPNSSISSHYPSYENPYEGSAARFDHGGSYFNEGSGKYGLNTPPTLGRSRSGFDQDFYEKKPDARYARPSLPEDGLGEGVYRYDGGRVEPYGARGTGSGMSSWSGIDDYGRSTSFPSAGKDQMGGMGKIVRAVPKMDTQQDAKNGVQKFRVKLLPEGGGQSTMDVLCQIGLDGIRMLDPSTNRTLRIYPLETVTRWEVTDSSTYSFWSKSSVDIESRRIRLQSNSYTTNTILDTVTAATVQLKEMGGKDSYDKSKGTTDTGKLSDQSTEKKKGLVDWMNLIKPGNEEKDHWVPDEAVTKCGSCGTDFGAFVRKHHCRNCGDIYCDKCTQGRIALTADDAQPVRVCDRCLAEVSQRLSNAKETSNKSTGLHTHEDLAKKLQEEMEKKFKPSSAGSKSSDGSGKRMREVACPICTVHLQVQVPTSGSETVECGVCQHPFLVSAH